MNARRMGQGLGLAAVAGLALGVAWLGYDEFLGTMPEQGASSAVALAPAAGTGTRADRTTAAEAGTTAEGDGADPPVFEMPPARAFVQIVQRPIFSPTRRAAPQGEMTLEPAASSLDLRLVGIIISSSEQMALVAPRSSTNLVRLSQGDRFQGWTVELIEPHRVTFRRDNVAEQIELSYDEPPRRGQVANRRRTDTAPAQQKQTRQKQSPQGQETQ
ncbi:MAG: hypothetical protein D6826_08300 [Alphaproteobacteria bacterium]|nr:MAG: hypothetical protein D6826_08300 [Alphaproteobacteria bacterium]